MAAKAGFAGVSGALETHLATAYALPEWAKAAPAICRTVDDFAHADASAGCLLVALVHVVQDPAARFDVLPDRHGPGHTNPPAVWDLHYLVAARAGDALVAQEILAQAARHLHRRSTVTGAEGFDAGIVLAFAPVAFPIADTASLWQALGHRLQPCLAYRVRFQDSAGPDAERNPVGGVVDRVPVRGGGGN